MNDKKDKFIIFLRRAAIGVVVSTVIAAGILIYYSDVLSGALLFYETMPFYNPSNEIAQVFKLAPDKSIVEEDEGTKEEYGINGLVMEESGEGNITERPNEDAGQEYKVYTDGITMGEDTVANSTFGQVLDVIKIEDTLKNYFTSDIVGLDSVVYQSEGHSGDVENHFPQYNDTMRNIEDLKDFEYLQNNFYTVYKNTGMTEALFDVNKFLTADMTVDPGGAEPKILIFHTHSTEGFADSDVNNMYDGIVGVGDRLAQILYEIYGIPTMHYVGRFDVVDGRTDRDGAYERMEPEIQRILDENPSIELAIDLHRDGVNDDVRLVQEIDGKPTAKIMFFNGLCKVRDENGVLQDYYLTNPYLDTNLALSFNMQLKSNELYPGFARKIFLRAYRFSLHMLPKSLLIEVGAQTNTKEEAFNSAEPIAKILSEVILKK